MKKVLLLAILVYGLTYGEDKKPKELISKGKNKVISNERASRVSRFNERSTWSKGEEKDVIYVEESDKKEKGLKKR